MFRKISTAIVFAASIPAFACTIVQGMPDGGGGGGGGGSGDYCTAFCAKANMCDNSVDTQTCTNDCQNKVGVTLSKLRPDLLSGISQCVSQKDCKSVLAGDVAEDCVEEGLATIAPSKTAQDFCAQYESTALKCDSTFDKAACLNAAKRYSDATLQSATTCFNKSCSDVSACVSTTLGLSGGTTNMCQIKLKSSSTTCNSCLESSCCAEDNACANNASCTSLLSCLTQCPSGSAGTSCRNSCATKYPSGVPAFNAWASCFNDSCSSSCSG